MFPQSCITTHTMSEEALLVSIEDPFLPTTFRQADLSAVTVSFYFCALIAEENIAHRKNKRYLLPENIKTPLPFFLLVGFLKGR